MGVSFCHVCPYATFVTCCRLMFMSCIQYIFHRLYKEMDVASATSPVGFGKVVCGELWASRPVHE